MALIARGKVQGGCIVFAEPLTLPDETEVVVYIEAAAVGQMAAPKGNEEFAALPFFGMWADREDMGDSAAWVRRERELWHKRSARQD